MIKRVTFAATIVYSSENKHSLYDLTDYDENRRTVTQEIYVATSGNEDPKRLAAKTIFSSIKDFFEGSRGNKTFLIRQVRKAISCSCTGSCAHKFKYKVEDVYDQPQSWADIMPYLSTTSIQENKVLFLNGNSIASNIKEMQDNESEKEEEKEDTEEDEDKDEDTEEDKDDDDEEEDRKEEFKVHKSNEDTNLSNEMQELNNLKNEIEKRFNLHDSMNILNTSDDIRGLYGFLGSLAECTLKQ